MKSEIQEIIDIIYRNVDLIDGNVEIAAAEIYQLFSYEGGKSAGEVAKEFKSPVGEIGCPHCGTTVHGAITSPICGVCERNYFEE